MIMARRTTFLSAAFFLLSSLLLMMFSMTDADLSATTAATTTHDKEKGAEENLEVSGLRIYARYSGPRGRRLIRNCASKIVRDHDDDDVVILHTKDRNCLQRLLDSDEIEEADEDNEVVGLGLRGGTGVVVEGGMRRQGRELDELVPWGMELIQADKLEPGPHDVTVCIVDSGIAINHPEFDQSKITGTDAVKFYGDPWHWDEDNDGHGTHVAGTIAARVGNDRGVRGVASSLHLHITRALDDDGRGYESDIRAAVEECMNAGANVINLSLGGNRMSSTSARYYMQCVEERGVLMVAASGNDGSTMNMYPAAHPSVISVSAVSESGMRWTGSNYGSQVELAAPGQQVMSTMVSTASVELEDTFAYPASTISGTTKQRITGELVACDAAGTRCRDASGGKICLFEKNVNDQVGAMLDSCIAGGGAGAIIYLSGGGVADDLRADPSRNIVAVGVRKADGEALIPLIGDNVSIGDAGGDDVEYSYAALTGTSMASPHVAAAAGLLMTHFADCSNHQIRYAMALTAQHPGGQSGHCDNMMGYGVVKVKDAYDWLKSHACNTWQVSQVSQGGCTTLHAGLEDTS